MQDFDLDNLITLIRKEDDRYHRNAYLFVKEGLDETVVQLKKAKDDKAVSSHVSGQQLSQGLRQHALKQFGPMARQVLEEWGIRSTSDFGEIVYNLIEYNVFSKTENDRREDFDAVYTFKEAFVSPFKPRKKWTGAVLKGCN